MVQGLATSATRLPTGRTVKALAERFLDQSLLAQTGGVISNLTKLPVSRRRLLAGNSVSFPMAALGSGSLGGWRRADSNASR